MLTKHDERKMPKNLGHIQSLARSHTDTAIRVLVGIMNTETYPAMSRVAAAKVLLDRGWGKPNRTLPRARWAKRIAPIADSRQSHISPETKAHW